MQGNGINNCAIAAASTALNITTYVESNWVGFFFRIFVTLDEQNRLNELFFDVGERDVEDIWKEHCQDKGKLQEYAEAMQRLATLHWGNQQQERVHWCREMLLEYFKGGGMEKCIEKDSRRLQR